jgi:hypothetical protein
MSQRLLGEEVGQHKTFQWIVLIFSLLFVCVLANGYYNLFVGNGAFIAVLIGIFLASLAWFLAKFIGTSKRKIAGNIPIFILLLLLSAVGVFNSLMINLEGKQIFKETIDDSSIKFKDISLKAKNIFENTNIEKKIDEKRKRIASLKRSFLEELSNPLNCGLGQAALEISKEIKQELPSFQLLSGSHDCKVIDKVKKIYDSTIDTLLENSPELVNVKYTQDQDLKNSFIKREQLSQEKLIRIRKGIDEGGSLLITSRPLLEDLATEYQNIALELKNYSTDLDIHENLEMNSVRHLGEWSQIINLIIARLDRPTTYVYLGLAGFVDWILVYLFSELSDLKKMLPNKKKATQTTGISSPW